MKTSLSAWDQASYGWVNRPHPDLALTVAQTIPDAQALVVTTPQEISLADVRKSINFCRQVHMKILGVVENMSGMLCPHCGKEMELFGTRGGEFLARKENLTFLGKLPLDPEVVRQGDAGRVSGLGSDRTPFTKAFNSMVDKVIDLTKEISDPSVLPRQTDGESVSGVPKTSEGNKIIFAVPLAEGKLCSHFGPL